MLHVILFLIKLMGWIMLAVLGLLVLLFCAALFTPLRYQVESGWRGELSTWEAGIKFQIFFRLVSGIVRYQKGELVWNVRVAWKKFVSQAEPEEVAEKAGRQIEITAEEAEEEVRQTEAAEERVEAETELTEAAQKPKEVPQKESEHKEASPQMKPKQKESRKRKQNQEKKQPSESQQKERKEGEKGILGKIAAFFEKIKYTFTQICDKIKALLRKKEVLVTFLTDEVHQRAFGKGVCELKKLLSRMKPKKIFGELRFGFADPSYTGRVLAGVRMLSAIWEEPIVIYPDFEQKILDGNLAIKGTIRALPVAALAWNMLWNRDVRRTIRDIRNFHFE